MTSAHWSEAMPVIPLLSGRRPLSLLEELRDVPRRYKTCSKCVTGVSYNVLTETLRRAGRDSLISRSLDAERLRSTAVYVGSDASAK